MLHIFNQKEEFLTLYERIILEHQRLQDQINSLQTELSKYPDGNLICCHHRNHCKWYQTDGHNRTYISKKDRPLAEQLAAKKYLSLLLEELSLGVCETPQTV